MHSEALDSMSSLRGNERGMGSMLSKASQVFILTDENVAPFWLCEVAHWLHCESVVDITIKSGEQHKNLQTVQRIWKTLITSTLCNVKSATITVP